MDADSFSSTIAAYLPFAPQLPGNAQPTVIMPDPVMPATNMIVGQDPDESSWSVWLDRAENLVTTPVHLVKSAWSQVADAASNAKSFVTSSIDNAENAVAGTVGVVKWIVVGLVALAILYGLSLLAPFLSSRK